jgi:spore coat polysaccharide biosynthesis protein SpsF (cytidylyltransferase family)
MGIVSLRLDCPLLDPCLLDRLIQAVTEDRSIDYSTYCSTADTAVGRLHSLMQSQLGLFAEYFRADALLRLDTLLTEPSTRREPAGYLWGGPDGFKLRLLSLPAPLDRSDLRLTLRHADDWDHAEQIVEALGYDHLDWQGIAELLHTQPSLRQHMARLNLAERDECGLARE